MLAVIMFSASLITPGIAENSQLDTNFFNGKDLTGWFASEIKY